MPALGSRAALLLGALILGACGTATDRRLSTTVDLVSRFPDSDCHADRLDLAFLLSRTLLKHRGWEPVRDSDGDAPQLWLSETVGRFELPLATTSAKTLRLTARCKRDQGPALPVVVSLNGRAIASLSLTRQEIEHRVEIPAAAQVAGRNELVLEALPRAAHPRPVLVSRLEIAPASASPATTDDPARFSRDGLWLPSGVSVGYALRPNGPGTELEINLRGGASAGRLTVTLDGGEQHWEVVTLAVPSGKQERRMVALPEVRGSFARLTVSTAGSPGLWVSTLQLRVPSNAPASAKPVAPPAASVSPNVVLFVADTVRADSLSAYGNPRPTSPRFDAFARQGCLFADVTAHSSWTRPCVASLLTGLGVSAHGVGGITNTLVPSLATLPEAFQAAGYATAAFVANNVLSPGLGFSQGFDTWAALDGRSAEAVVGEALGWTREQRRPFFLYIHTLGAHRPLLPKPEHWRPFLPPSLPRIRDVGLLVLKPHLEPDELALVRSAYEGEVHEDDAAFGALLDGLDAQGVGNRTAVAFTADHGEGLQEHGRSGHGGTLYQEVLHVPLAVRAPGLSGDLRVGGPVPHTGLAPTLLQLAGVTPPADMDRGLGDLCGGRHAAGGDTPVPIVSRLSYAGHEKIALRWGSLKLVANEEPAVPSAERFELFDLAKDPRETENLAGRMPEAVEYLWTESQQIGRLEQAMRVRLKAGRTVKLSPAEVDALRALGYVH